jgi:hypothetical protein
LNKTVRLQSVKNSIPGISGGVKNTKLPDLKVTGAIFLNMDNMAHIFLFENVAFVGTFFTLMTPNWRRKK